MSYLTPSYYRTVLAELEDELTISLLTTEADLATLKRGLSLTKHREGLGGRLRYEIDPHYDGADDLVCLVISWIPPVTPNIIARGILNDRT